MGYRGKVEERERARELRAEAWTLADIAAELGVSKGTVSSWVRDVDFEPHPRRPARKRGPNKLERAKAAEIERLQQEGRERIGRLSERELLIAGVMLYAGEGAKRDHAVQMANSDPRILLFFVTWLRRTFEIDESRLRLRLYLHEGLDLAAASSYWATLLGIPASQHQKPYRAVPDSTMRSRNHPMGVPSVVYSCSRTHRSVMGMVTALLSSNVIPG